MDKIILEVDNIFPRFDRNLIICHPTGVFYTQQVGHHRCEHPEVEGFVLSLHGNIEDLEINDCGWMDETDEKMEMGEKINSKLLNLKTFSIFSSVRGISLEIDFDRIQELMEAWWPVNVWGVLGKKDPSNGYVVGSNCD